MMVGNILIWIEYIDLNTTYYDILFWWGLCIFCNQNNSYKKIVLPDLDMYPQYNSYKKFVLLYLDMFPKDIADTPFVLQQTMIDALTQVTACLDELLVDLKWLICVHS